MKIAKPSDADKEFFRSIFDDRAELEVKPMFGNLAASVVTNRQMCAGLFGPFVGLRLDEKGRAELLAVAGAGPFGPEDRPMKEYVALPSSWREGHEAELEAWVDRAIAHTASLAPKPAKKKK